MIRQNALRFVLALGLVLTSVESRAQVSFQVMPFDSVTLTAQQVLIADEKGIPATLAGELRLPRPGTDKLPLVILNHGIGGLFSSYDEWARQLNGWGYAVFMTDHLSGRAIVPMTPEDSQLTALARMVDVYRAFALLSKHPRVDPERIAVMGFSLGGLTTLAAAQERFRKFYGPPGPQLAAYIAVSPVCWARYRDDVKVASRPIRIFHGTADDWNPVEPCRALVADLKKAGADITLTEFTGVAHGYDMPGAKDGVKLPIFTLRNCALVEGEGGQLLNKSTGAPFTPFDSCIEKGVTVRYDATATAATRDAVKAFLTSVLAPKPSAGQPSVERGSTAAK